MLIKSIHIGADALKHMRKLNSILFGSIIDLYLNLMKRKMKLTETQLPDKRYYETYSEEYERNRRYNELKNQWKKPEQGFYDSINGRVYFIIYK